MIKINIEELEHAIDLIKKESLDVNISIHDEISRLKLVVGDKAGATIEILLYDQTPASPTMPKVRKTSNLGEKK